ncbi:MAG: hypothetical protein GEV08_13560 [Acidimicrobiia bacterium]|nr:hypothetical protein [Acidimicrobiia bacterium]
MDLVEQLLGFDEAWWDERARRYRNDGGTFELADEATGDEELVVGEPLPFRLVPALLQRWFDDFVAAHARQDAQLAEREAQLAERDAEIERLRRRLGDEPPSPPSR